MFSDFQRECWGRAYLSNNKDPHQVFANLLQVSRQEAKVLCIRMCWEIDFLNPIMNKIYEASNGPDHLTKNT